MNSTYSLANDSAQKYSEINKLIKAQKYIEAENAYQLAIKNIPQQELAQQKFLDLQSKISEGAFNQAIDLMSKLLDKNSIQNALPMFDLAIKINPDYCRAYIGKAIAYRRLAEYDNVLKAFTDASSCSSCKTTDIINYNRFALSMGKFLYTIERYQDAIKLYDIALNVKADNGDIKEAKYTAQKALEASQKTKSSK